MTSLSIRRSRPYRISRGGKRLLSFVAAGWIPMSGKTWKASWSWPFSCGGPVCDGGFNDGNPCTETADCVNGNDDGECVHPPCNPPDQDGDGTLVMPTSVVLMKGGPHGDAGRKLIDFLLSEFLEPTLIQPTFLYNYPRDISPLAKSIPGDALTVERFEGYMAGFELCNAFTELNDPLDQEQRFLEMGRDYTDDEEEKHPMDEDYLRALCYGMPPTGGLGVGVDRLVRILADADALHWYQSSTQSRRGSCRPTGISCCARPARSTSAAAALARATSSGRRAAS